MSYKEIRNYVLWVYTSLSTKKTNLWHILFKKTFNIDVTDKISRQILVLFLFYSVKKRKQGVMNEIWTKIW